MTLASQLAAINTSGRGAGRAAARHVSAAPIPAPALETQTLSQPTRVRNEWRKGTGQPARQSARTEPTTWTSLH